jgi:Ca-activated chloride channel homolog
MTLAPVRARKRLAALVSLSLLLATACSRRESPAGDAAPSLPKDAVVVKVSYGSEKKGFLTDSIEAFHASNPRTAGGKPIRIEAVAEGSAESMEAILAGQSDVHVWSPASSLLVDVLNARWAEKQGLGGGRPLVGEAPPLVLSPVVVAMWKPMAEALGWPTRSLGWSDLASLASSREGWAKLGKPQWGDFKLGHTHPRFSNSGAVALVAATYAGARKSRDLTLEDSAKAAPFVRQVQSSIVHYGRSTGFFAEKMLTRGPAYLSAAILYESNVAESYIDPKYKDRAFDLVAIYPREGTFWADHPWAVLDLPTVTPAIREAAEAFRKYLMSTERQQVALTRYGFRPADTAIPLGAPIDAAHGLDPAQPKNVLPNPPVEVTRRILDSFESVKRPVAITFVLDTSGSMKGEPFREAQAGAKTFLESLPAEDSARVLLFSSELRWVDPAYGPLGERRPSLTKSIDESFAGGGTALYDAVLKSLEPAAGAPEGAIRAVVVLTDGEDTDSRTRLDSILAELRRHSGSGEEEGSKGGVSPPRLFTIAYGKSADADVMKKMAEAGGGAFFAGTPKNIRSVYAELASFF